MQRNRVKRARESHLRPEIGTKQTVEFATVRSGHPAPGSQMRTVQRNRDSVAHQGRDHRRLIAEAVQGSLLTRG